MGGDYAMYDFSCLTKKLKWEIHEFQYKIKQ